MARVSGIVNDASFPYGSDLSEAPYTDGIIGGGLGSNFMMGPPNQIAGNQEFLANQGKHIPGGIKDSSLTYVNCNRIWYAIFAGDF